MVGMSSRLCGEWAVGFVVVAHVIIVSPQFQLDLDFDLGLLWVWV